MTATQVHVSMSQIHVQKGPSLLTCLGLGSCIGFCAFDPEADLAGLAHIMLPASFKDKPVERPGKFADTAIPALLDELIAMGADPGRILVAYAGGAQVFRFGPSSGAMMDIGTRNAVAVEVEVRQRGLQRVAVDVGGTQGRTLSFCSRTGEVRVRTVTGSEKVLCALRR